ncbi:MAG: thioredoxin reductase [Gammaproteobacteria bacterium]|jgi:thioredoxin reductase
MSSNKHNDKPIQKVAVIGAGASGLVTARELLRQGFDVTIFEQSENVGGLWVYDSETESDNLGLDVDKRVHSSLYSSLRTNLPRDIMAFSDYRFDSSGGGDSEWPRFPHHTQVCTYLTNFAKDYHLVDLIRFNTQVVQLQYGVSHSNVTLELKSLTEPDAAVNTSHFDAVAICNGHFANPRVPQLEGMNSFSGKVLHSHNYREPKAFKNQRVAVFGVSASGVDIAREIASQAASVYWCGDTFNQFEGKPITDPALKNLHFFSCPNGVNNQGQITFKKNQPESIDSFVYATGYNYDYPFITQKEIISVDDNYISPLYNQIIPPNFQNIGFIGIPFLIVPFPLFEIQARWFAQVLKQKVALPSANEMTKKVKLRESELQKIKRKKRLYHQLGEDQIPYLSRLLREMNDAPLPQWFSDLIDECQRVRTEYPATYRDEVYSVHGPSLV